MTCMNCSNGQNCCKHIGMTFDEYQAKAEETAMYPKEKGLEYVTLGLVGEAGELANKVKKVLRGDYTEEEIYEALAGELGDVLWYAAMVAKQINIPLDVIAQRNLDKLAKRKKDDVIKGDGDDR